MLQETGLILKNIALQVDYPSEFINIYCDYDKLVIALQNILINAVEAIEHDSGRISIKIKKDKEHAVIEITDNGSGIKKIKYQDCLNRTILQKEMASALVSPSTLNIIQAHSGSIEVTFRSKKVNNFYVTLPLKQYNFNNIWGIYFTIKTSVCTKLILLLL